MSGTRSYWNSLCDRWEREDFKSRSEANTNAHNLNFHALIEVALQKFYAISK